MDVLAELFLGVVENDAVLWTTRTGDRWNNSGKIQFHVFGVLDFVGRVVPQTLFLGVCLYQFDVLFRTTGQTQVVEGNFVDWEHRGGRTELWGHVTDGCTVCQWY